MKVWLVRHGQTYLNKGKKFVGRADSRLTPVGKRTAKRVGVFLRKKNGRMDSIYSSPLNRAKQTAGIIGLSLQCRSIIQEKRLVEQDFGLWERKTRQQVEEKWPGQVSEWLSDPYKVKPLEGENYYDLEKRLGPFIKKIKSLGEENVVVVTHGNVIRVMAKLLLKARKVPKIEVDHHAVHLIELDKKRLRTFDVLI